MGIKAKCRNCNKEADSDSFKLHYKYRLMVCPDCFSGRTEQLQKRVNPLEKMDKPKPAGWDAEDEYLEKVAKLRKEENQAQFSRIAGTKKIMCKCAKCNYSFRYDPFKKLPNTCPGCDTGIPKLRTHNLL
tara:strand:- start:2 stop:391 length:390 start_codon:yes stop_codon:yes gene_type:complete